MEHAVSAHQRAGSPPSMAPSRTLNDAGSQLEVKEPNGLALEVHASAEDTAGIYTDFDAEVYMPASKDTESRKNTDLRHK